MKPATNDWRRFRSTEGAAMLEWVRAGNVAVIVADPKGNRTRAYELWARTPDKLAEAAKAIGFLAKRIDTDPFAHVAIPSVAYVKRAWARCHHVNDTRRDAAHRRLATSD